MPQPFSTKPVPNLPNLSLLHQAFLMFNICPKFETLEGKFKKSIVYNFLMLTLLLPDGSSLPTVPVFWSKVDGEGSEPERYLVSLWIYQSIFTGEAEKLE